MFYKGVAHRIEENHHSFEESMIHLSQNDHMFGSFLTASLSKVTVQDFLKQNNEVSIRDRIPVLAYGSNVCLAQLLYKSSLNPNISDLFLCFRAVIKDTDVLYGSFLAPYGALPAIIGPVEGAETEVWVTLLDREQLELMNKTEGGYEIRVHNKGKISLFLKEQIRLVYAYYYPNALQINSSIYRFSDIPGKSPLPSAWQADMLNELKQVCRFEGTREEFIHLLRWNHAFRVNVHDTLKKYEVILEHPDWAETGTIQTIEEIRQS
jgi:hypothetical protein